MAEINNAFYEDYGDRWYEAWDDPVALLRAQGSVILPWVNERIREQFGDEKVSILDVGCGAGLLSNELGLEGHAVTGIDMSPDSLRVAQKHDPTRSVTYMEADALHLPFPEETFQVITCMDFLEHVHFPARHIQEMARVLRPGGLFFYHTFNRNLISWLLIIKGVEWLVKNTPKDMHVIDLFITPDEIFDYCQRAKLETMEMTGIRPVIGSITLKSLFTGVVSPDMRFTITDSVRTSYMGFAKKTL